MSMVTNGAAPGGEAPAIPSPAGGEAATTQTPEQRRERAMELAGQLNVPGSATTPSLDAQAAAKAAEAIKTATQAPTPGAVDAGALAGDVPADAPQETAEEREARLSALTPEDRAAEEAREAGAAAAAPAEAAAPVVEEPTAIPLSIPVPGRETPFELDVFDPETAEIINGLVERAGRADRANAVYERAQGLREQAEEFHHIVELDPAGVMLTTIKDPNDLDHMARFLLTRPGFLARHQEYINGLIENPDTITTQAQLMDLERMKREQAVTGQVNERREQAQYTRQLTNTLNKSIETYAPDGMKEEGRALLFDNVAHQIERFKQQNNLKAIDLRRVAGFVSHQLSVMGLQPKTGKTGPAQGAPAAPAAPVVPAPQPADASRPKPGVVAPSQKTAADLKKASADRAAAASAPPGPGGVANGVPQFPAYDPAKPGTPIQQRAAHAKVWARSLVKKPQ